MTSSVTSDRQDGGPAASTDRDAADRGLRTEPSTPGVEPAETAKKKSNDIFGGGNQARELLQDFGSAMLLTGQALRLIPMTLRLYLPEVARQAGSLVVSSSLVIWSFMMILGAEGSLEAHFILRQLGAKDYTGIFTSTAEITAHPSFFAWVLAAKVGCGLVAEIGSMRISDEIDALEVMGIRSLAYLVTTRLLAIMFVMPFWLAIGFGLTFLTSHFVNVEYFASTSAASYETVFWTFLTPQDLISSIACGVMNGIFVIAVGCYYGYTASGGPVGVGNATAKSMIVSLCIVGITSVIAQRLFFAGLPYSPISF